MRRPALIGAWFVLACGGCGPTRVQVDVHEQATRADSFRALARDARLKSEDARRRGEYVEAVQFEEDAQHYDAKAKHPDHPDELSMDRVKQMRQQVQMLRQAAQFARAQGDSQKALQYEQDADRLQAQLLH